MVIPVKNNCHPCIESDFQGSALMLSAVRAAGERDSFEFPIQFNENVWSASGLQEVRS